jgi:hypothetical protein
MDEIIFPYYLKKIKVNYFFFFIRTFSINYYSSTIKIMFNFTVNI